MTSTQKDKIDLLAAQAMEVFEQAASMKLGLSEDESAYDLTFIRSKLAICSTYQERLSDMMMKLSRISIETTRILQSNKAHHSLKEKRLKATEDYRKTHVTEKGAWLADQLRDEEESILSWQQLHSLVSEVKEAVAERASTMKRLDSDLRLHSKLYEAGVAAGATAPTSFTGSSTAELDIE